MEEPHILPRRCEFSNRLNDNDFRIGIEGSEDGDNTNSDLIITSVKVSKVGASIQLGDSSIGKGISANPGDNPNGLITGVQDGKGYWQTNRQSAPPATNYLYMKVNDNYIYNNSDYDVLIAVEYFDEGNGRLALQYDSPGEEITDQFKNAPAFNYGDTKSWKTYTYHLDDAIMTNRANGADFRLATGGSPQELKISSVKVSKIPKVINPKEGLQAILEESNKAYSFAKEGEREGMYPIGSKAILKDAINGSRVVFDDEM